MLFRSQGTIPLDFLVSLCFNLDSINRGDRLIPLHGDGLPLLWAAFPILFSLIFTLVYSVCFLPYIGWLSPDSPGFPLLCGILFFFNSNAYSDSFSNRLCLLYLFQHKSIRLYQDANAHKHSKYQTSISHLDNMS